MNAPSQVRTRSIWQRFAPVSIRQNLWLLLGAVLLVVVALRVFGAMQIRPIVFSQETASGAAPIIFDIPGKVGLFDRSSVHSIALSISQMRFQTMVDDFTRGCEKSWIEADAIIDGTLVKSVGIRLKGNSTLMSLRGQGDSAACRMGPGMPGGRGRGAGPGVAGDFPAPGGPPRGFGGGGQGGGPAGPPGFGGPGGPGGPGGMGGASFDTPNTLPMLLSFDKFVAGRAYQGRTQLAIRPVMGGAGNLNEALALQLIKDSGQFSQEYTWVTISVNGSPTATRLVIENPDQNYAARLGAGTRAIYKSRSTNSFTYRGEDPTLYVDDFSQVSGVGSQDLGPVIHLLRWLQEANAETFDRELAERVDVLAFARYVATHELLNNFDDMAGPGRNFLLSYDLGSRRFTVVTWDMNLAISGMGGGGGRGGFGPPGGGGVPRGFGPPGGGGLPGGFGPPRGGGMPGGFGPPGGEAPSGFGPPGGGAMPGGFGGRGGMGMGMGNQLKSRFVESAAFAGVIQAARDELSTLWFSSGHAVALVGELAGYVPVSDSLTAEQISREAQSLTASLARN